MTTDIGCSLSREHRFHRPFRGKDHLASAGPANLTSWIDDVAVARVLETRKFAIALGRVGEASHATHSDNITGRL